MRSEFLKNGIIWYNSCEDYIYQAIWFAFDMNENRISSAEDYQEQLKKANYGSLKSKLEGNNTVETKMLLSYIEKYRFNPNVLYMRDNLANNLKHRGNLSFKGLEDNRMLGFTIVDKDKNTVFNADWVEPIKIDIDESIEKMALIHVELIKFAREIKDFIDFDNMFELDEEGNILLNIKRDKNEYKKVVF